MRGMGRLSSAVSEFLRLTGLLGGADVPEPLRDGIFGGVDGAAGELAPPELRREGGRGRSSSSLLDACDRTVLSTW